MLKAWLLLTLLVACGIPSSQQYPPLPSVDPGELKVTGGEMSFTGAGDPAIRYRLWYKIYPWTSDSEVADLVKNDVTDFDDNVVRDESGIRSRNFRPVRVRYVPNSTLDDDLSGAGKVVIKTDNSNSFVNIKIGNGPERELGRDIFLTGKPYKGFFGEFLSDDPDVSWSKFSTDFGLLFLVQSVRLDEKLLKWLYSTPVVVGYYVIKGEFNNNNG